MQAMLKLLLAATAIAAAGCGGGGGGNGGGVTLQVTPSNASLFPGTSLSLAAAVQGTSDLRVTWSVDEGAVGGGVTTAGVYTAPVGTGTYHVTATSVADPNQKATVAVTVAVSTATGTIR